MKTLNYLDLLETISITGGDIQDSSGVLVDRLADGTSLTDVFEEFSTVLSLYNNERSAIARLLSFPVQTVAEAVPQSISAEHFEPATEHGVPKAIGRDDQLLLGATFDDWDVRSSYTWKFLRDASIQQVRGSFDRVMEADNRLVTGSILQRLFDPTEGVNEQGHRVFGLWNGTDSLGPLPHLGQTWPTSHSHYVISSAAAIDSADVEAGIRLTAEHGYGRESGGQLLILAHPAESAAIQTWQAGVESRPSGPVATFSFVPSVNAPAIFTDKTIIGAQAPEQFNGLEVLGSYGRAWLIESQMIPQGYFALVATAGADNPNNVIAFREHVNPSYRSLRQIPGNWRDYPIIESFYQRSFGVGTRHRGAAVVTQIKVSGTYDIPTIPI